MITETVHTIKISEIEAKKKAAFYSIGASYDKIREELTYKTRDSKQEAFRLVWEGEYWITMIEGTNKTITSTLCIVEEFETEDYVLNRIAQLGLEPLFDEGNLDEGNLDEGNLDEGNLDKK